ncbi:hypothetical protein M3Y99_01226600 [Aphelenchoides fujianensis]|nr:hypothetical protein M3Y99_01226600 [Aphelenchoides fujianensis]
MTKKEFEVHAENIPIMYHRATSNALLYSKAKRELAFLPPEERVIFEECWRGGKNVLQLAKCVAAVLDARDRLRLHDAPPPADPRCADDDAQGGWLMGVFRAVRQRILNCDTKGTGGSDGLPLLSANFSLVLNTTETPPSTQPPLVAHNSTHFHIKSMNISAIRRPEVSSTAANPTGENSTRPLTSSLLMVDARPQLQIRPLAAVRKPMRIEKLARPQPEVRRRVLRKRNVADISPRCNVSTNVQTLRDLQRQFDRLNHVVRYLYSVTKSNQKFLEEMDVKVDYRNRAAGRNSPLAQAREFAQELETYDDKNVVSILSPKLLNLLKAQPDDPDSKRWLSPNMLSFSDEGMLPLPRLLQMSTSDHCETMAWLDLLMDLTGAKKMFDHIEGLFGPFMRDMEQRLHPRVQEVERHDQKFESLQKLTTSEQKRDLDTYGYARMNEEQLKIAYHKNGLIQRIGPPEFSHEDNAEEIFEEDIRALAKMTDADFLAAHAKYQKELERQQAEHKKRVKRQSLIDILLPMTTQPQVFGIRVLNPFAFTTRIRNANIMGNVLAPAAFRLMLFSPLTMTLWASFVYVKMADDSRLQVMVPEAFILRVFSPKAADLRVMAPEAFSMVVLSPGKRPLVRCDRMSVKRRVLLVSSLLTRLLSPSFGTYQLWSGNRHVVQGKAKRELASLPPEERVIFEECWRGGKNVLQLAKCVAAVLDARDRLRLHDAPPPADPRCADDDAQGGWLMGVFRALRRLWFHVEFPSQPPPPRRYFQRKRINRRSLPDVSPRCGTPANVRTLRRLQQQFHKLNHVIRYLHSVTKSNQKFLEQVDMKVDYRSRPTGEDSPLAQARRFAEQLESFDDKNVLSILSPKLLNLLPQDPEDPDSKRWLSPNMLSFADEGMLPLPRLLQLSTSDHCETMAWLDLLMDLTGAKRMFDHIEGLFGPFMRDMEQRMHPRVQEVEQHDQKFESLQKLTTLDQERELDVFGYAKMNADQLRIAYGREGLIDAPTADFSRDAEADRIFEEDIRALSRMTEADLIRVQQKYKQMEDEHRQKRQAPVDPLEAILPMTHQQQIFGYRVLNGFAFTTRIRNANVMGPYILSPYAFYLQIVSPSVLHVSPLLCCLLLIPLISGRRDLPSRVHRIDLLARRPDRSVRLLPATVYGRNESIGCRILAPSAFRLMARLMSPLALTFWTLVPEAFLAKIMSPKFLDARILKSFSFILLSPAAGIARVGSPNAMNFLVLSPSFGSYQLWSGNRHVVQVLSPGILGLDSHPLLKEDPEKKFTGAERPIVG